MANHCYNFITINGDEKEIKEFSNLLKIDQTKGQDSLDIYENIKADFETFQEDAKWFDIYINDEDETCIILSGDSAWCPALELFTAISKKYQSFEIRYEYEEMGYDFSGWADINKGECLDNCFSYWEGKIKILGETEVLYYVIESELECYETEEELIETEMFNLFGKENQNIILEEFKTNLNV